MKIKKNGVWENFILPVSVPTMMGASSSADGTKGLVPAPATGDQDKYLKADGTWGAINVSNDGVRSIASGSSNGTISVNTNGTTADVAVTGLGSAAYTESNSYAASDHNHSDYVPTSDVANSANKIPRYNADGHLVLPDGSEFWIA